MVFLNQLPNGFHAQGQNVEAIIYNKQEDICETIPQTVW